MKVNVDGPFRKPSLCDRPYFAGGLLAQKFQRGYRPPEGHSVAYLSRDLVVYPDNPRYLIALLSSSIRHFTRVMWRSAVDNCPMLQISVTEAPTFGHAASCVYYGPFRCGGQEAQTII